ncbi:MAG: T9SS type A sorting domain-containing protein [Ignavibacteria bacterium]|nr:T9SS type A sorting domain-containing protein [Ignavibacteria bacterium]
MWTVPTSLPNGKYRIKISNGNDQFGLTSMFIISDQDQVATPLFLPNGGEFNSTQQVRISCATVGAEIRYTDNLDEPNQTSILYNDQTPIVLNSTKTLKAKAFKSGYVLSMTTPPAIFVKKSGTKIAQVGENGTEFGVYGILQYGRFYYGFPNPTVFGLDGNSIVVKAHQDYKPNTTEKWNVWQSDVTPYWINFANIGWNSTPPTQIIAHFKTAYNTGFSASAENIMTISDSISLKDPWLIDDYSSTAGKRNRGVNATFYTKQTPFTISTPDTLYKGVFLNQNPQFQPNILNYSVKASQTKNINLGGALGTRAFYFQNWNANPVGSAEFKYSDSLTTGVVFKADNAVVSANYKGTQLSNTSTAFTNNSQRKFINLGNNRLYYVYSSMNKIWMEKSSDNGTTWGIANGGKSLTNSTAKLPAVAAINDGLLIVCQTERPTGGYYIKAYTYSLYLDKIVDSLLVADRGGKSFAENAYPVIARKNDGYPNYHDTYLVVWEEADYGVNNPGGLYYYYGNSNFENYSGRISGTDQNSHNPTLAAAINDISFHLGWQQSSYIAYRKIKVNLSSLAFGSISAISFGSGNSSNLSPTIIEYNGAAKIAWKGSRKILNVGYEQRVTYREISQAGNLSVFSNFGSDVNSPVLSRNDYSTAFVLGWSENNGADNCFTDEYLSLILHLNTTGKDLQLSNGTDKNSMYAMSFNNSGMPYFLTQSNNIQSFYSISKANSLGINKGREGVVAKGSGELYFTIGDVNVNGENISFKTLPDSFSVNSINDINNNVRTTPFAISDNSQFNYSVQYGITDSAEVVNSLSVNDVVSFRVELVDEATNVVLGLFDNVSFTKQQAVPYENISYQVATEGIGNRTVYLRLITTATEGFSFSLANLLDNQNIIAKKNVKEISYKSTVVIKDYALAQNYPNPFNPVTTITYQLPKSGSVTLKIFDILGNEVKTLVNEQKEMGRYTVQFDASSLASGMYVYQLRANDYTSTKKMLLLK